MIGSVRIYWFLIFALPSLAHISKNQLIIGFLKENDSKFCSFVVCWDLRDEVELMKSMMLEKIEVRTVFAEEQPEEVTEVLKNQKYQKIMVVLDTLCENYKHILYKAARNYLLTEKYVWFVIGNNHFEKDNITDVFMDVQLRLDSNLQIAIPDNLGEFKIYGIYNPGIGVDNIIERIGTFSKNQMQYTNKETSFYESRKNLTNVLLRTGNTVNYSFEKREDYVKELRHREIGTFGKFNFALFLVLKEVHNFNYNTTLSNAWFGNNSSGNDGGVAKLVYEKVVDIGAAGGLLRIARIPKYDYLIPFFKFRTKFFFRDPGSRKPGAEVLKPFSTKTWYTTVLFGLAMSLAIRVAYWVEYKFLRAKVSYSTFTSIVIAISVFAQQGSAIFPNHLGGRIIYLNLLILSIFIYNYYTSSLVSSLLSTKPNVLKTIKELSCSDLKFGIDDQPYTITYILQQKDDVLIQKLNSTKIYETGKPNLLSPEEGIAKVREGGFAYHTEFTTAYPLIAKTFDQDQICDLNEIDFIPPGSLGLVLQKNSQYKELFMISLAKFGERGISNREHHVWITEKSKCLLQSRVVSVGINELFLVYMILIVGIFLSLLILTVEFFWHKFYNS